MTAAVQVPDHDTLPHRHLRYEPPVDLHDPEPGAAAVGQAERPLRKLKDSDIGIGADAQRAELRVSELTRRGDSRAFNHIGKRHAYRKQFPNYVPLSARRLS